LPTLRLHERKDAVHAGADAPAALVLLCFQVVPILTGANASFRDWTLYDPKNLGRAGNFIHVLRDAEFLQIVLPNTFGFMIATVALSLVLGLMIALVLNKRFAGRWLVQSFVLLPLMVAPVIAAIDPLDVQRPVRRRECRARGPRVCADFLAHPALDRIPRDPADRRVAVDAVVRADPVAGLQSLPPEPFEAAQIDAAGAWRTFRYITLPMLRPVMVVCVVIRAIDAFRTFDIVWTISGGGPARATECSASTPMWDRFNSSISPAAPQLR
jgi:multiple sugar transport system permease protein